MKTNTKNGRHLTLNKFICICIPSDTLWSTSKIFCEILCREKLLLAQYKVHTYTNGRRYTEGEYFY